MKKIKRILSLIITFPIWGSMVLIGWSAEVISIMIGWVVLFFKLVSVASAHNCDMFLKWIQGVIK